MSSRFENKLILPRGVMGPTTLLELPPDDLVSVERWHRREWDQFREEIKAYKQRVQDRARDFVLWNRDHCLACKGARAWRKYRPIVMAAAYGGFRGPRYQRGILNVVGTTAIGAVAGGDCTFTASTVPNLSEFNIEPTDSYTHARLHTDGDWYWNEATNLAWGSSKGTWQGGCAIADYDSRWNHNSGTTPNSNITGTDGVWHVATTSAAVGYSRNFGIASGTFDLQLRDGTSLNVLFTDSFSMYVEVDARN